MSETVDMAGENTALVARDANEIRIRRAGINRALGVLDEPSVQRSLPTIKLRWFCHLSALSLIRQPERTTLYASLPELESRVVDALTNANIDAAMISPATG